MMKDCNRTVQPNQFQLVSKSLQYHMISKSKVKSKKKPSFCSAVDLNDLFHAFPYALFRNPHENVERNQILRIEAKQPCQLDETGILSLQAIPNSGGLLKIAETFLEALGAQECAAGVGKNIIRLGQLKYKRIETNFQAQLLQPDEITIRGDFQSGNLAKYKKIASNKFLIILNNDANTQGYTQWFQFYIEANYQEERMIDFVVGNIRKPIKFFPGMKLLTRRNKNYDDWKRNLELEMVETDFQGSDGRLHYAIRFTISSLYLKDGLYVALGYPYPYSRLKLLSQEMINIGSDFKVIQIGRSTLGNSILVYRSYGGQGKRNIFILARQHASETSSSFICESIIKRLSLYHCYDGLTKQFNWHVIPVANPDGVIQGNSRVNIKGYDMNRCWAPYLLNCSSQAQCINSYLQRIQTSSEDIFLDLHSHSRDLGFFTYATYENCFVNEFNSKLKQICPYFDPQKCKIGYSPQKKNTFRVQMQSRFKIKNILTLETSFYGYLCKETGQLKQFYLYDYERMAVCILKCIESYGKTEKGNESSFPTRIVAKTQQSCSESSSDSDPEGDYLDVRDRQEVQEDIKTLELKKIREGRQFRSLQRMKNLLTNSPKKEQKEKIEGHPNIVNLYNGANSNSKKSYFQNKTNRIMSACKREDFSIRLSTQFNEVTSGKNKFMDFKSFQSEKAGLNPSNSETYTERKSFKNLFACAQLRNSINLKKEKGAEETKQSKRNNVKNITFPKTLPENEDQLKKLRELENEYCKKNIGRSGKGFFYDRKAKVKLQPREHERLNGKVNDKIALLCEYVRKFEPNQSSF